MGQTVNTDLFLTHYFPKLTILSVKIYQFFYNETTKSKLNLLDVFLFFFTLGTNGLIVHL